MNLETFLRVLKIPKTYSIEDILDMLIIYLRKSRKDMDYFKDEPIEKTLERHEKDLQEYVKRIFGKPIPEKNIYREVASGDTIEDRPVMQEVLKRIEDENVKGVICIEIERLARGNTIDQGIIAQTFKYTNTKIITPMKIYNLDNEDDLSYFEDGLYQSRKYLTYVKRILNRGRERSVKEGNYVGSVLPYGWGKEKIIGEKGYMLVENKEEADVIRLMADLFLFGLNTTYLVKENDTVSSIAKLFGTHKPNIISNNLDIKTGLTIKMTVNSENRDYKIKDRDTLESIAFDYDIDVAKIHIPNNFFKPGEKLKIIINDMRPTNIAHYFNYLQIKPRKAKEWTANMIRNILKNYSVYGYLTWNRRKTVTTLVDGKIVKTNPKNDNCLIVKGKQKPILNEEYRRKIMAKFKENSVKTLPENLEQKNPLVGLVKCGYCGNNMTRRPYYVKKGAKPTKKRKYAVDREKLRNLLRSHKGDYSLNDIARYLHLPKYAVDKWFVTNDKRFVIPYADKWYELKELLKIETDEFDKAITIFEESITPAHEDTLMCSRPRCKCVSSNLELVEDRILKSLYIIKDEYKIFVNNYDKEIKKEIDTNKQTLDIINHEIDKTNQQIEKACELVETGAYTQDLFIKRTNTLNVQLEHLIKQKEELLHNDYDKELNQKKKAIPIIENVLNEYSKDMTAEEKNKLLSTIIKEVIYTKEKGGRYLKDNFQLKIILLPFD